MFVLLPLIILSLWFLTHLFNSALFNFVRCGHWYHIFNVFIFFMVGDVRLGYDLVVWAGFV